MILNAEGEIDICRSSSEGEKKSVWISIEILSVVGTPYEPSASQLQSIS